MRISDWSSDVCSSDLYLITLSCPNRPGIVASVATMLYEQGGNILEAHQFDDIETGRFFMRVVFNFPLADNIDLLRTAFGPLAQSYGMDWNIRSRSQKKRVLLLDSKFDHRSEEHTS